MHVRRVYSNHKLIATVFFFTDTKDYIKSKTDLIRSLTKTVSRIDKKYLGFRIKKRFKYFLLFEMFGRKPIEKISKLKIDERYVIASIKKFIFKSQHLLPSKTLKIFIFPSFNELTVKKGNGVNGYAECNYAFFLFLNPQKGWKKALDQTIPHEYHHTVVYRYHKWQTLLDDIVFEGMAENFREKVVGLEKPPWIKAFPKTKIKKFWPRIKKLLKSRSVKIYNKVFWDDKEFPLWTGYTIGYYIVKEYLRKTKKTDWTKITKTSPKEVLKVSGYL